MEALQLKFSNSVTGGAPVPIVVVPFNTIKPVLHRLGTNHLPQSQRVFNSGEERMMK